MPVLLCLEAARSHQGGGMVPSGTPGTNLALVNRKLPPPVLQEILLLLWLEVWLPFCFLLRRKAFDFHCVNKRALRRELC